MLISALRLSLLLLPVAAPAFAQVLLNGNHSINGSLCVGLSCTGVENFTGSLDLKVKDQDVRMLFEDSSISANIPTRDWAIDINDNASFGSDYFAIRDADSGLRPFFVMGGAPQNSLVIGATGNIGLGTFLPEKDLHIARPLVSAVRLEVTNSARKWDVAADSVGLYFFSSASGSGTIPVDIRNGAPDTSLTIVASGNIGMGTDTPSAPLHVRRADGTASLRVENTAASPAAAREMFRMVNNGGSYFTLANTASGKDWFFVHENAAAGRFFINHSDGGRQMALDAAGNMTLMGELFTAGSCSAGCDRVFDADYPLPSIPEQAALMKTLKHLPNVGPTPENGPFNLTKMTGGMLNELEKAHLYIAELEERDRLRAESLTRLEAEMATMRETVAAMQVLLAAPADR
ncbi:hypothetical protein [Tropicibacter sp. S64]|uniref:hypothetical protein n=1 Tax=Tropicibacter sp. S64 TaxID=3415122 RepID=UPI003C7D84D1